MTTLTATTLAPEAVPATAAPQRFGDVLRSEWIKFRTVRSTTWSLVSLVALGVGLTAVICATSADWLASGDADESPGSFVLWGMMIAQVVAVVLGALFVTSEYGTGTIRATLAAVPRRSQVVAAKAVVLTGVMLVAGTATAFAGYLAGNFFLDRAGVGVPLDSEGVLRSLIGNGLYLAGLALFTLGVGLLVRHTAAALTVVLALLLVVGNMAPLLPGVWGEWVTKVLPGNAGSAIITPVTFNPELLGPWTGFGVFMIWVVVAMAAGWVAMLRRDA